MNTILFEEWFELVGQELGVDKITAQRIWNDGFHYGLATGIRRTKSEQKNKVLPEVDPNKIERG